MNFLSGRLVRRNGGPAFAGEDFVMRLPDAFRPLLDGHSDRAVELGVRPEDLDGARPDAPEGGYIPGEVLIVEALGNELLVYVKHGAATLIWRCDPHLGVQAGQSLRLVPAPQKMHLFDIETGRNLAHG